MEATAFNFFEKKLNTHELQTQIESYLQKEFEQNPSYSVLTIYENLWKESQKEEFGEVLISKPSDLNDLFSNIYSRDVGYTPSENNGYIAHSGYQEVHAQAEQIRTYVLFAAQSSRGESEVFIKFTKDRWNTSAITYDDVINAYSLITVAETGRPKSDPKQGEWMEFYKAENPVYRLVAIRNILRSAHDNYDGSESELPTGTLKNLISRKLYLKQMLSDPIEFIALKAKEEIGKLDSLISKIETQTGLSAGEINMTLTSLGSEAEKNRPEKPLPDPEEVEKLKAQGEQITEQESFSEAEKPNSFPWWLLGIVGLIVVLCFMLLKGRSK